MYDGFLNEKNLLKINVLILQSLHSFIFIIKGKNTKDKGFM